MCVYKGGVSMQNNKTVVTKEQRQIVLHSAVIQDSEYNQLKSVLEKYESITDKELEEDPDIDQRIKDVIRNAFIHIYNDARKEWESVNQNDEGNTKCSLCNQPNKLIFFIKNKYNGNTLNVGSTCISHFSNLKDAKTGESTITIRSRFRRNQELVNRKTDFRVKYDNLGEILTRYQDVLNNSKCLLAEPYYGTLSHYIDLITRFEKEYLSGKIPKKNLDELETLIASCTKYVDKNVRGWINKQDINYKLLCNRQLANWLENQKKYDVINTIRNNNSRVEISVIQSLYEINFLEKQLPLLREKLRSIFNSIKIYDNKVFVTLKDQKLKDLVFYCTPKVFMEHFGRIIFVDLPTNLNVYYCLKNVVNIDEPETVCLIEVLNKFYRGSFKFLLDEETQQIYIIRGNRYVLSNISNLTRRLAPYFIKNDFLEISMKMFFDRFTNWLELEKLDEDKLYKLGLYD